MTSRRWLALALLVVLAVATAAAAYMLPEMVRRVAVGRIQDLTGRPVAIERVELGLLSGRVVVHGFRLAEREGNAPFADFERLQVRLRLPALLVGHLSIRELVLERPVVRIVRLPGGDFNIADLLEGSGEPARPLDVTVDWIALAGGTVILEDRALPEPRTWTSERIEVEGRNISTRTANGTATARSVTVGAAVALEVQQLRLYPIHLKAHATTDGLDLSLARLYLPPDSPVVLERGRAHTSLDVELDAREGVRAQATVRFEDLALVESGSGDLAMVAPELRVQLAGLAFREGDLQVEHLDVAGALGVPDPRPGRGKRIQMGRVRASAGDFTWPARRDGRVEVHASIPEGGTLIVSGAVRPPPAPSRLRLRLADLELAPWTRMLPLAARIGGLAEADLRIDEPLAAGVPARVHGVVAVNRLAVTDAGRELIRAGRIEASGLEVQWPDRVRVTRLLVARPRAIVERDRTGAFPLQRLGTGPAADRGGGPGAEPRAGRPAGGEAGGGLAVEVGQVLVRGGSVAWRDDAVAPPGRLDVSAIDATLTGVAWPAPGPVGVRAALRLPGGGRLEAAGRVGIEPVTADLRLAVESAELAPYEPYLALPIRVTGAADADVAVVVPEGAEGRATVRGHAALSRLDVRQGERTVMRVERAAATGIDVEWPERIVVQRVALSGPWLVVERDAGGRLALPSLLAPRPAPTAGEDRDAGQGVADASEPPAVKVARIVVEGGGLRVADQSVSPPVALDLQQLTLRVDGLATAPAAPARVDLTARIGASGALALRGSVGAIGGPLRLDLDGELRQFGIPRLSPYVEHQTGWHVRDGWLATAFRGRLDGDALSARTDVRVSQLQLTRAAATDEAQRRIGLPLGLLVGLLKDGKGDIALSFPVSGRLHDPRFDFREAIWAAVRRVAVNTVTLPLSWIGRVQLGPGARIEHIEIDPVRFEPGTAQLAAEGREQAMRLAAFLEHAPEMRLALTPVISSPDVLAAQRRAVDARVERLVRGDELPREAAAARLFQQRFRDRAVPASVDAALDALAAAEDRPEGELRELAAQRADAVRAAVDGAGIDPDRLRDAPASERPDADAQVELALLEPEAPRPSPVREFLRRIGVPPGNARGAGAAR